ncbi:PepSY-like domain-containing protein [Capnocytophaga sp.]|uniref:PepSY-like domain-containing protein n=1 Tax=Capnocytophaga sp. TaxID=44737 RepID=UPI0026DD7FE1|nr:PepSY-like domain-containing protein [Capnocytophaga sp.]MDO5104546.1 PepSY-like domain-containing protein [Capnocytophaga sp.]
MKKTLFLSVLALGSLSAFAQERNVEIEKSAVTAIQEEEYTEVEKDKLPAAVVEAFAKTYEGATINKAFVNAKEEYKIEATDSNSEAFVVYFDKDGNLLKK